MCVRALLVCPRITSGEPTLKGSLPDTIRPATKECAAVGVTEHRMCEAQDLVAPTLGRAALMDLDTTGLFVGDESQYFFDNGIIEIAQGVTRTIHSPKKIDANPLIQKDRPWEHITYFTFNGWHVWRDEASGTHHCLYTDWKIDPERVAREGGSITSWDNARLRQLYASSDNGIDWHKPPMGIQDEAGHDTNIVFGTEDYGSAYDLCVVDDPLETDPRRRYKTLFVTIPPGAERAQPGPGALIRAAFSADAIHWTPFDRVPMFGKLGAHLNDVLITTYDPATQTYLNFTRHPWQGVGPKSEAGLLGDASTGMGGTPGFDRVVGLSNRRNKRRIFLSESRDFLDWTEPRIILAPDPELDNLDDSFYGMAPYRLGNQWIGFLNVFHMVSNTMTPQLLHSRDGRNWNRLAPGRDWLDLGAPGSWDQFMINMTSPPIADGPALKVYFGGARNHHDWWFAGHRESLENPDVWKDVPEAWDAAARGYFLGLATMRLDGFVSLDAHRLREGVIVTQPVASAGDRLTINAACGSQGYVKVEILDATGAVLPDRGASERDAFVGDSVHHEVTWKGDSLVPRPDSGIALGADSYRRLRFIMRDSQLYSFRIFEQGSP